MRLAHILQDREQALAFLTHIIDRERCAEIRILDCTYDKRRGTIEPEDLYPKTISGWFDDPEVAISELRRLYGVSPYVTVNPVNRAMLPRACNRLKIIGKRGGMTSDQHIVCYRWLFIDIDPVRPSGVSSTDDELTLAVERRDTILADHPELAASSLWGRSGNGAWILVRLPDYSNDAEHAAIIARMLDFLGERYSDGRVKIDSVTRNASRVMCIPGCLKTKGDSIRERPHRLATIAGGEVSA